MKTESYNREILHATAMFMDAFNDITIRRASGKLIKVKLLNGRRSRIFKSLENPARSPIKPPLIAVVRTGITRDTSRVSDLNRYLLKTTGSDLNYNFYPPNPMDLTFQLTLVAKTQSDMDRMLSNFIPFCNQSFFVNTPHPKLPGQVIKHEVIWNGNITETDNSETSFEDAELIIAETDFTFKTWMGAGTENKLDEQKLIKKFNIYPNLFSIGVQQLLSQSNSNPFTSGFTTAESLCASRGYLLDDDTYYGDIYSLSHFYAVPTRTKFSDFETIIASGKIDPAYYDSLPISGLTSGSPDYVTSGYLQDLNLDLNVGDKFTMNGNEVYFVDNKGGILIMYPASGDDVRADAEVQGDYWANVRNSSLTGILSGVPSGVISYSVSGQGATVSGATSGYSG